MYITGEHVECLNRSTIPSEDQDISEVIEINEDSLDRIEYIDVYYRDPFDCPFARGNWIIDIRSKNGDLLSIKLPKEMSEEAVYKYAAPILQKSRKTH